jgi:hypothetical protein
MLEALAQHKPALLRLLAAEAARSDLSASLLAHGTTHSFPRLPYRRGTSIAAGELHWKLFAETAGADELLLAIEAARAASTDGPSEARCIVFGCEQPPVPGDAYFCHEHHLRVAAGESWGRGTNDAPDDDEVVVASARQTQDQGPDDRVIEEIDAAADPAGVSLDLDALYDALFARNAQMHVHEGGRLHYTGPRLAAGDAIRRAISHHHDELVADFTYGVQGPCILDTGDHRGGPA